MNPAEIRSVVMEVLESVAPEIDKSVLDPRKPLRGQVDLDSMDWLNCELELSRRFGLEIPEQDYSRLGTLEAIIAYLEERLR